MLLTKVTCLYSMVYICKSFSTFEQQWKQSCMVIRYTCTSWILYYVSTEQFWTHNSQKSTELLPRQQWACNKSCNPSLTQIPDVGCINTLYKLGPSLASIPNVNPIQICYMLHTSFTQIWTGFMSSLLQSVYIFAGDLIQACTNKLVSSMYQAW